MTLSSPRALSLLTAVALLWALLPFGVAGAQEVSPEVDVVIEGLRNPKQLSVTEDGNVLVAEAGTGGDTCFSPDPEDQEFQMCYGRTGRVTEYDALSGDHAVVLDGLPSMAGRADEGEPVGEFATGPHGVVPQPGGDHGWVVMGFGADPRFRELVAEATGDPAAGEFATLLYANLAVGDDDREIAADLGEYEAAVNPDDGDPEEDGIDSNPYSVLLDGDDALVVDAGGNSLLRVPVDAGGARTPTGDIETVTVPPRNPQPAPPFIGAPAGTDIPGQPVPTSVALGPDDTYLLGELPGFPFHPGAARVWSAPDDGVEAEPELFADGFANIIDLTVGPDGHLYVLEFANEGLLAAEMGGSRRGALVRYLTNGRREVLLTDPLTVPGGLAFADDDTLYVSNCSICPDGGELLRVTGMADVTPLAFTEPTSAATIENQPITIDVLANDSPGLEIASVVDQGQGATLVDGLTYQPAAHFSGQDRIKYQACHDDACVIGEAIIEVEDLPTGRFDGPTRVETAVRVARGHFPRGADTVVLARSDRYPDALAGSVLAAAVGAPILLTPSDALHPAVVEEINRLGAGTAYILGGDAALTQAVEDAVVAQTSVDEATRVSGRNRYETAVAIRDEIEVVTEAGTPEVFVAEGEHQDELRGWPDVLSVSPLAAYQGRPILLAVRDALPPATAAALADEVDIVTIVGGTAAVSTAVEEEIGAIVDSVSRVGGATRYETSTALAELAIGAGLEADLLYLATGRNWPDALAAGPAVAQAGGIMVLVDPEDLANSPTVRQLMQANRPFTSVNLLGGERAISQAVETQIRAELQ